MLQAEQLALSELRFSVAAGEMETDWFIGVTNFWMRRI
jgi:hypothetical protein